MKYPYIEKIMQDHRGSSKKNKPTRSESEEFLELATAFHKARKYDILDMSQNEERVLENQLLEMWHDAGVKSLYKYKNRVKAYYGEGRMNLELFYDISGKLFTELQDIASNDSTPEEEAIDINTLINNRI